MSGPPKSVGSIGAGNMAEAMLQGMLRVGLEPGQLLASDPDPRRREHIQRTLGVPTTESNAEVVTRCELVVLAVKPMHVEAATADLPQNPTRLYVSIIAGCPIRKLFRLLPAGARIVRAMPNTPALIGSGITALAADTDLAEEEIGRAEAVLASLGRVVRVPESLLDAVTGLSGSGPAYVYLFIEALTEAGVHEGLGATLARELAVETVLGAARMVRETAEHPALLRERVSSPGGTTVAGLAALEQGGLRAAVLAAVHAATARSRELAGDS